MRTAGIPVDGTDLSRMVSGVSVVCLPFHVGSTHQHPRMHRLEHQWVGTLTLTSASLPPTHAQTGASVGGSEAEARVDERVGSLGPGPCCSVEPCMQSSSARGLQTTFKQTMSSLHAMSINLGPMCWSLEQQAQHM